MLTITLSLWLLYLLTRVISYRCALKEFILLQNKFHSDLLRTKTFSITSVFPVCVFQSIYIITHCRPSFPWEPSGVYLIEAAAKEEELNKIVSKLSTRHSNLSTEIPGPITQNGAAQRIDHFDYKLSSH